MMEGSMQTLSLGNWMQLPDLPFKDWLRKYRQYVTFILHFLGRAA